MEEAGGGGGARLPEILLMGGSWAWDSWFSRKERSSKDSLIWRYRISRFLRRQNWVLTPASLPLIISPPRPNQIRWNRGNESLPERAEAVGETLTLPGLVSADNGTYTCEASNKHGHARALYVLVVYGEDLRTGLSVGTRPPGVSSPSWVGLGLENRQDGSDGV